MRWKKRNINNALRIKKEIRVRGTLRGMENREYELYRREVRAKREERDIERNGSRKY